MPKPKMIGAAPSMNGQTVALVEQLPRSKVHYLCMKA